jgi:probable rRNA maturation factor
MIEITNEHDLACNEASIISAATYALDQMGIHPDSELSISIVDEAEMTQLHIQWMDLPGPTDVLSFPMDEMKPFSAAEGPGVVGDIVLCPEFAAKQAVGHSVEDEISLLTMHGVLHLLGYDHLDKEEEREMFALQEKLLSDWKAQK